MNAAWVLGSHGLLGSALRPALLRAGTPVYEPAERLCWSDPGALSSQLERAVREFSHLAGEGSSWEIYWSAGTSSMGTSREALARETAVLSDLLDRVSADTGLSRLPGSLAFASSAGAIYAGSRDVVVTEESLPAPTTDYARAKIEQEAKVRSFAAGLRTGDALVARLSTLYGPGQARGKQQGLLAHIARCLIRNRAVHIYVPLDTVRDYITSDDAASAMISSLRSGRSAGDTRIEIIASERPTTIAEIVAGFRRISRRSPRIIASASRLSALYPRQVRFRSVAWREAPRPPRTSLLIGIHALLRAELQAFAAAPAREG